MTVLIVERFQGDDGALQRRLLDEIPERDRSAVFAAETQPSHRIPIPFQAAIIRGVASPDAVSARLLLTSGRFITHLDSHTADLTAIERAPVKWDASAGSQLDVSSIAELIDEVKALAGAIALEAEPGAEGAARIGDSIIGIATRRDTLVDEVVSRQALALSDVGRGRTALAVLKARAALHDSAVIARTEWRVLAALPDAQPDAAVMALERAIGMADDSDKNSDLANLVQITPVLSDEERVNGILTELADDQTYGQAWWIQRLLGMLAYRRATRQRARSNRTRAIADAKVAAHHYDQSSKLHARAREIAYAEGLDPNPSVPISPIIKANAYDAHWFAGQLTRANRRHRDAMRQSIRLAEFAATAAASGGLTDALLACQRVTEIGWTSDPTLRCLTLASVIQASLGEAEASRRLWQRARQIDAVGAAVLRRTFLVDGTSIQP